MLTREDTTKVRKIDTTGNSLILAQGTRTRNMIQTVNITQSNREMCKRQQDLQLSTNLTRVFVFDKILPSEQELASAGSNVHIDAL